MITDTKRAAESVRDYALRVIKQNIINLVFEPGSIINEQSIADEMDCSRTPVREALQELSRCGVIEILPQRGNRVSLIDYALIDEITFIRKALECAAIDEICAMEAQPDYTSLEENLVLQNFNKNKANQFLELDNEFHALIYDLVGKKEIYERFLGLFFTDLDRVRALALKKEKCDELISEHEELLRLMKKKAAADAKKLVKKHFENYLVDKKMALESYPARFFKKQTV